MRMTSAGRIISNTSIVSYSGYSDYSSFSSPAPLLLYSQARIMSNTDDVVDKKINMSWNFKVDSISVSFCTKESGRKFSGYISTLESSLRISTYLNMQEGTSNCGSVENCDFRGSDCRDWRTVREGRNYDLEVPLPRLEFRLPVTAVPRNRHRSTEVAS
ncbi:hypothetical protein ZOSMA_152G00090 [Zostera marina]|uniref:Uncharacterized protein n=1 Tax=Zostera marina TaxID=29655 RepID=A0A0K9PW00_ZOSMR|nr:hypothetical protein ZOSMA_152G00090 [Zostera marina]